jgi:hypothetical protein
VNLIQLKNIFFTLSDFLRSQIDEDYIKDENFEDKKFVKSVSNSELKSIKSFMSYETAANSKAKIFVQNTSCLNYELFADSLSLASLHTRVHEESSEVEKLIFLAEKMSMSKGVEKSQLRSGETL